MQNLALIGLFIMGIRRIYLEALRRLLGRVEVSPCLRRKDVAMSTSGQNNDIMESNV